MAPRRGAAVIALLASLVVAAVSVVGWDREARRDEHLQPERVMDAVGVRPGMVIGEVGAGSGYFTVKLARRVGPRGQVWANDIDREALDELEKRCETEGLRNVTTVVGEETNPLLPRGVLELVFFVYSFHDVDEPVPLLQRLRPSLKPGATVVVLDQDPEVTGSSHFLRRERVLELFAEAGFEQVPVEDFLDRELLLVFRPAEPRAESDWRGARRPTGALFAPQ